VLAQIIERERPTRCSRRLAARRRSTSRWTWRMPALSKIQGRDDRRVDQGDQDRRGPSVVQGRDARIGLDCPQSGSRDGRRSPRAGETLGFPLVIRPSFTLGGIAAASPTTSRSSAISRSVVSSSAPSTRC
jgi:hypothetical protein